MKALLLILAVLAQQSDLGIVARYDRFKDETVYRVTESLMPDRPGFVLFSFITKYKGEKPKFTKPEKVTVLLESYTDGWYFLKTKNVMRVIRDGERFELGEMEIANSSVTRNGVSENLTISIPFSSAQKLSTATKLEMQIGRYEVEFKPETISSLKKWVESFQ